MTKLVWDATGERLYETGVKNGVLYVQDAEGKYPTGVAWNGLINVTESPSGAEASPLYADDIKYLELTSNEEFGGTIEAYTYPEEFGACNGEAELVEGIAGVKIGQQKRKAFGFSYTTTVGNDLEGDSYGYKIHLVYGAKAAASEKAYATINDSPEAITFSWEFTTTPVKVEGFKPTAHIEIDSTKFEKGENGAKNAQLQAIEDLLYGSDSKEATLPSIEELIALLKGENA